MQSYHLPLTAIGSNPARDFEFIHVRKVSIQLMKQVVLLRCAFVSEIIHRGAPEVYLHQYSLKGLPPPVQLERCITVLVRHKT
jgi:hypothetical protein